MHVLVTGGAGFIGRNVAETLLAAGHDVRVLDSLAPSAHPAGPPEPPPGAEFVRADVTDPAAVAAALDGVDAVAHQAAMVGRGKEIMDAPAYAAANGLGTATLLAAMTVAGIGRLVLASSVVIYGDARYECPRHGRVRAPRRSRADLDAGRFEPRCPGCGAEVAARPVEEDDPLDPPRNVYAVTKLAQEHLAGAWAAETGGTAVALRYHSVYGPAMPFDSAYTGVIAVFRSAVERGEPPNVFEDGLPRRDFVHVRDVAAANLAALGRDGAGLRAYNIATGTPRSVHEVARAVAAAAGGPEPVVTGDYRIGDVRHVFGTPERAARELGWRAAVPFEGGIKEFTAAPMLGAP